MAKGNARGLWKGKVGNDVFYKITNSNNAQKQGIRQRVIEVSNPQSSNQALQRMKLLPANRLAAALKSIIERGFEGVKYGAMSRQAFMKYALAMDSGYPYVKKDDVNIYPGRYIISKGSLPTVDCELVEADKYLLTGIIGDVGDGDGTFGGLSNILLSNNPWLQGGDQITIVQGVAVDGSLGVNSPVLWGTLSFILNTSNQDALPKSGIVQVTTFNDHIAFTSSYDYIAAGTVIVSRESTTGGHLRSTQTLVVSSAYNALFTDAVKETAKKSYMKKNRALNSDWPQEAIDAWEESGGGDITPVDKNFGTTTYMGIENAAVLRSTMKVVSNAGIDIAGEEKTEYTIALLSDPSSKTLTAGGKVQVAWSSENKPSQISLAEATSLRSQGYTIPDQFAGVE